MSSHHISFKHAFAGFWYCLTTQPNFRFHLLAGSLVILAAIYLHLPAWQWLILVFTILLVLTTEMINTALEAMTDLLKQEYDELAKTAKDVSAGMVLLTAFGATLVGLFIFLPYLLALL